MGDIVHRGRRKQATGRKPVKAIAHSRKIRLIWKVVLFMCQRVAFNSLALPLEGEHDDGVDIAKCLDSAARFISDTATYWYRAQWKSILSSHTHTVFESGMRFNVWLRLSMSNEVLANGLWPYKARWNRFRWGTTKISPHQSFFLLYFFQLDKPLSDIFLASVH